MNRLGHPSSRDLRVALRNARGFEGVSGLTGFSDEGVPRRQLQLLEVRGGQIQPLNGER